MKKYKKKLQLDDTEINVVISGDTYYCVKKRVSPKKDTFAEVIDEDNDKKKFTIIFYNYDDLVDNVLHELLHIRLWKVFGDKEKLGDLEHELIDVLIPLFK